MCNATTKSGNQCKVQKDLVDGLCVRHRSAPTSEFSCSYILSVKNKEDGTTSQSPCGAAADSSLRCRRHGLPFVVFNAEKTAVFGPFKSEEEAKNAAAGNPGSSVIRLTSFSSEEETKTDRKPCVYILKAGRRKGEECGKRSDAGLCIKHSLKTPDAPCAHILSRGDRKGEPCGVATKTGLCAKHSKPEASEPALEPIKTQACPSAEPALISE